MECWNPGPTPREALTPPFNPICVSPGMIDACRMKAERDLPVNALMDSGVDNRMTESISCPPICNPAPKLAELSEQGRPQCRSLPTLDSTSPLEQDMLSGMKVHLLHVTCPESAGTHTECHFELGENDNALC